MSDTSEHPTGEGRPMHAAIYDLGYKRYVGTRRPQRSRYRVIVKNLLASAWRGWWRMKLWVVAAALTTVSIGSVMYVFQDKLSDLLERGGIRMNFADGLVPFSFVFFTKVGFVLTVTVGATVIANDLRAGAFEFYFSRSVRPVDYIVGKVGGLLCAMAMIFLVGPLLLTLFRLGLSDSTDELLELLPLLPKTLLVGAVATVAYAVTPLAFSAISARHRHTLAAWAAFYLIAGHIFVGIAHLIDRPELGALDLATAVTGVAWATYDVTLLSANKLQPSLATCLLVLSAYTAAALALVYWRVARAERAGMGGG